MSRKLAAFAVLAAGAVTLAAVAAAGPVAAKQQMQIQIKGGAFVLTPLTPGAVKRDTGVVTWCCWSSRTVTRDGQPVEVNNPQMTLTGKRGTLVTRNRIEWADLPDGWSLFTGTWKVVRGTGDYAGLSGGGLGAGIDPPAEGVAKSRFEGVLRRQ